MEIDDVKKLLISLMKEYDLFTEGWNFRISNEKRSFGRCKYVKREISISRPLAELNDEAHVKDTILHEIAHALCGSGSNHGRKWRRTAMSIGCTPKRCYGCDVVQPLKNVVGVCPHCGKQIHRYRIRRGLACSKCCKENNQGKWSSQFAFEWKKI